ncbi:hypothetical protein RCG19_16145 [Neobacillus sp. OS1-2]|uniref:hypothetical protein n=1 Tax=Neobacillus sp. OS1-2 TaxID=3070680 RepID=UPI0027DFC35D|nr:hypothetical protein [Neobacillus sp. OS1-2]WML38719.1 hypothetical protein RCG19_16145 [Neobacillus sp. OS1-2]
MSGKRPKSVSFNEKNMRDNEILTYLEDEHISFAPYVKDLIFADMQRRKEGLRIIQKNKGGGIKIVVAGNTHPPSAVGV